MEELIKKYPRMFQDYEGNPCRVNWYCPPGWIKILDWLCGSIQEYIDNINIHNKHLPPIEQVQCLQVKEKYATLRFYYCGGDSRIDGMVDMAEHISSNICEECGTDKNVSTENINGWLITSCEDCREKI